MADLAGAHVGRVPCVGSDNTKVVACGKTMNALSSRGDRAADVNGCIWN